MNRNQALEREVIGIALNDEQARWELFTALEPHDFTVRDAGDLWVALREMKRLRKTDTISPNIVDKRMDYWEQFPVGDVQKALATHLQNHPTMKENYTDGILRGLREERDARERGVGDGAPAADLGRYEDSKYAEFYIDGSAPVTDEELPRHSDSVG